MSVILSGGVSQHELGRGVCGRQPPGQTPPPPSACWDTHPLPSACWDTRLQCMLGYTPPDGHCSGRYASYWNAFLFKTKFDWETIILSEAKVRNNFSRRNLDIFVWMSGFQNPLAKLILINMFVDEWTSTNESSEIYIILVYIHTH